MKKYKYPSVLTIAGSDGSGGAGIQGDIKTISSLGCYAASAITALTVQNTCGVTAVHGVPADIVCLQIKAIIEDIVPDAIKIGMVHTLELVATIAEILQSYPEIPVILDPVMIASSGHKLMEDVTICGMTEKLFPLVTIITPNLDEASILANMEINNVEDMRVAGAKIMRLGCKALLLKGGHLKNDQLVTLYFSEDGKIQELSSEKIITNNTHGTGCTLSSAIASFIARGMDLESAVRNAQEYVYLAILNGADVVTGNGNGPLNHFFNPQKLIKNIK